MTNWFSKLKNSLKKSSTPLTGGISNIFNTRRLDDTTLDELEELFICSDMGITATTKLIKDISSQKFDKKLNDTELRQQLAQSLNRILSVCEQNFEIPIDI